jgi:hypothetical protein
MTTTTNSPSAMTNHRLRLGVFGYSTGGGRPPGYAAEAGGGPVGGNGCWGSDSG